MILQPRLLQGQGTVVFLRLGHPTIAFAQESHEIRARPVDLRQADRKHPTLLKSESKAYEARYVVKTGSAVKIVETDKGTSKVYDAKYGAKSGSATQIIETEKNGVSKVYDAKYGAKSGSATQIIETDKNGVSKVYDAKYGAKSGSPRVILEKTRK